MPEDCGQSAAPSSIHIENVTMANRTGRNLDFDFVNPGLVNGNFIDNQRLTEPVTNSGLHHFKLGKLMMASTCSVACEKFLESSKIVFRFFIKWHVRTIGQNYNFGIWQYVVHSKCTSWPDFIMSAGYYQGRHC